MSQPAQSPLDSGLRAEGWAACPASLAARQLGVVTRTQLLGAGLSRRQIETALSKGRLHLLHRGVYAVGHPALPPRGRELAALLACGPNAVLSHRSAATLWDLCLPHPTQWTSPAAHRTAERPKESASTAPPPRRQAPDATACR